MVQGDEWLDSVRQEFVNQPGIEVDSLLVDGVVATSLGDHSRPRYREALFCLSVLSGAPPQRRT